MTDNPRDLRYTKEHEWVRLGPDGTAEVGITHFAQDQLGDIVYIDLPAVGSSLTQLGKMGEVESVKSVSDLYSPVTGEVVEVNQEAVEHPEQVNEAPYDKGWLIRVRLSDPAEPEGLLTADQYEALVADEEH